jgi:hypothetical protein
MSSGEGKLIQSLQQFNRRRNDHLPDCQKPDASPDLPITHGLQLAGIEARLAALEAKMTNQNRLLLIGVLALVGELAKQVLSP